MNPTRIVLDNPTAGYVALLLIMVFGAASLGKLPIQLTPEVQQPEISVTTAWRAASPEEIEAEIIEPQEDALKSLPGLERMLSEARENSGVVRLTFALDMSLERALIEVVNRLNGVSGYPVDADRPILSNVGDEARPIAWFILSPAAGNDTPIGDYYRFIEEVVQTAFERTRGVALSEVRGGMEKEVRITIDPYKAAGYGILLPEAARLIQGQEDISAGDADIGKRSYNIRFRGAHDIASFREMVIDWRDGRPIRLRDIAEVSRTPRDRNSFVITKHGRAIAVNAYRETGVNVLEVMSDLRRAADALARGPLKRAGLEIEQVYDETVYIESAIQMLTGNLGFGILLAGGVLWFFTRRLRATLVVGLSIPISLFATLVMLQLTGRTLNMISLAALALSVGMVLDASIIVIENILRLRERGLSMRDAAQRGVVQIRGALVASTTTTVAIFLPVVLLRDEAGQLFADLAVGLSTAILVSLATALFLAPGLANRWLARETIVDPYTATWDRWTDRLMRLTDAPARRKTLIVALFAAPIALTAALAPKADYLPAGSRNLVFATLLAPPGMNTDTMETEIGRVVAGALTPHVTGDAEPRIAHYFFVSFPAGAFMGARAVDPDDAGALEPLLGGLMRNFPGVLAFARRASLFSRGNTRTVEVNLQGRDFGALLQAAYAGYGMILGALPGARIQPKPGLELANPQLRLLPNEDRMAEAGWSRADLGMLTRVAGDGLYAGDHFDGQKKIDIIVRFKDWLTPEDFEALPVMTPRSGILPFGELARAQRGVGPESIRRIDRLRTVTLEVIAPPWLSLQETIALLREKVEPGLQAQLPADARITYSGSADKLSSVLGGMLEAFVLATLILYLLIAALFRSFRDALLVLVTLPLATVGGVLMLRLVNLAVFQPMDLLTMIGFIIMLGVVVNNAILLVHQTRAAERAGRARDAAVREALRTRLRPIMMSTATSVIGMLPLLLSPGAGAELYRGLAGVIIGGLLISTVFTLVLLPALLRLGARPAGAAAAQPGGDPGAA